MASYKLRRKTHKEIMEFVEEHPYIYARHLVKFLNVNERQAYRIINDIKNKYDVKTSYISWEIFILYAKE